MTYLISSRQLSQRQPASAKRCNLLQIASKPPMQNNAISCKKVLQNASKCFVLLRAHLCTGPDAKTLVLPNSIFRCSNLIHVRATRNHPLSQRQEEANRKKSQVRVRIEHVFGAQETSAGGRLVRTIGIVRARAKIGLQNLVYNVRRLVTLERMAAV